MYTLTDRRRDLETRKEINNILGSFDSKEAKSYWLNVLVKNGRLSEGRAGQLTIENDLI